MGPQAMRTKLLISIVVLISSIAQANAKERDCGPGDEPAEIQGTIRLIVERSVEFRGRSSGSFLVKDFNTGTCLIDNVIFSPELPPECHVGSTFFAKGKAIGGLLRLVATSLVCK